MLAFYLTALLIGLFLLGLTAVGIFSDGDSGDVTSKISFEKDFEAFTDLDPSDSSFDPSLTDTGVVTSWLPLLSIRFWVFFGMTMGLSGILFTSLTDEISETGIFVSAIILGYSCAIAVHNVIGRQQKRVISRQLSVSQHIGAQATVMVAVRGLQPGKVRLHDADQILEVMAVSRPSEELAVGASVLVVDACENGLLTVTQTLRGQD